MPKDYCFTEVSIGIETHSISIPMVGMADVLRLSWFRGAFEQVGNLNLAGNHHITNTG